MALGTIAVLSFFILLEAPIAAPGRPRALPGPARAERFRRVVDEVSRSVTGYMLGNIADLGHRRRIVVSITLVILGVPFAVPARACGWRWSTCCPLVGGLLAGVPVVIIALFHSVPAPASSPLVVFLVYQQIENHILNPVIMSRTVRLNPLWVLLAVLVGAKLGGHGRLGARGRSSGPSSASRSAGPSRSSSARSARPPVEVGRRSGT